MAPTTQLTSADVQAQLSNGSLSGPWTLDSTRSSAALRTKSVWGLVRVKGVFRGIEGAGQVAADGTVTGRVSLATASLDTKNRSAMRTSAPTTSSRATHILRSCST